MGPIATCDLQQKIICMTDAKADQEHIHVYVDCNTNIPDRTDAILNGGADPIPEMVKSGIRLQSIGADVLLIPCNTAHYFFDRLLPFFDVPVLHMLRETAKEIKRRGIQKVGLLATDGTICSKVYEQTLSAEGIKVVIPSQEGQADVMSVIYNGIKASNHDIDLSGFQEVIGGLFESGAEVLILGCTELPVAFKWYKIDVPHIDPTVVLAKAAIEFAGLHVVEDFNK